MDIINSRLYELFSSLSEPELKELDKAINSSFFNYRKEEARLFEYLAKQRKLKNQNFSAEKVTVFVFGKKTDLAKLRHVMTYLSRIITRYIAIHEMEENEALQKMLLLTSYRKRKLEKQFLSTYTETEKFFLNEALLNAELYFHQLQLHLEFYNHSIVNRKAVNEDLIRLSEDLDAFYIIQKLKQACTILSYQNIFKFDHKPELMNEILAMAERKNGLKNPLVKLLYFNYQCLNEPQNEAHFTELKKALLHESAKRIELRELRDIYTLAINYCIKRLNTGSRNYFQEVFDIYKTGLSIRVFEENGKLSQFTYKNISAIAIGLNEYHWVKKFIEEYKSRLEKELQEGFYAYCLSRYYFAIADYERVSDLLREVEIKEQFTDLDARVLLIKTYYELDEINLLDYAINNLKQQLKRKKLKTYHGTVYGNFVKTVSRLTHLRPYDKKEKQTLREKLATTKAIAEKEWLLSKMQ